MDNKAFKAYFLQFGAIDHSNIVYHPETKNSRCFGFVLYKNLEGVEKLLSKGRHFDIEGKTVRI